jgi:dihydroorotase
MVMSSILIQNTTIVNDSKSTPESVLIINDKIASVGFMDGISIPADAKIIDGTGLILIPGVIDTHVHFREPGLTHKADIFNETTAAVAGGVTSFMDMPNTVPQTVTLHDLENKYLLGAAHSLINYSFYLGATNENSDEIARIDPSSVCGIKLFMGSSTGNMLVNDENAIIQLFKNANIPIVAHCEDEATIKSNIEIYKEKYGDNIPIRFHPMIRNREACFISSESAIQLARENGTRLHIAHVSTADELKLFDGSTPIKDKKITSEACIPHLWLDDTYYDSLGTLMKVNPAIKTKFDRDALINGITHDLIDTVSTDHAPHTLEEKNRDYLRAPSGTPMVQHSLTAMLELWKNGSISIETIVKKMCHNPAIIFGIKERGFIREGYKADLCLVDPNHTWEVEAKRNIFYKCGWSLFENQTFSTQVVSTIVNGRLIFNRGSIDNSYRGERLRFDR